VLFTLHLSREEEPASRKCLPEEDARTPSTFLQNGYDRGLAEPFLSFTSPAGCDAE